MTISGLGYHVKSRELGRRQPIFTDEPSSPQLTSQLLYPGRTDVELLRRRVGGLAGG